MINRHCKNPRTLKTIFWGCAFVLGASLAAGCDLEGQAEDDDGMAPCTGMCGMEDGYGEICPCETVDDESGDGGQGPGEFAPTGDTLIGIPEGTDASSLDPEVSSPAEETTVGFVPLGSTGRPRDVRGTNYVVGAGELSHSCASGHDALWFCAEDRWLAGENRHQSVYVPGDAGFLVGTDLGYSVRFGKNRRTFFYMGDSFGTADVDSCGTDSATTYCNDAILAVDGPSSRPRQGEGVRRDQDASNGIEVAVAVGSGDSGEPRGFWPVVVDGVNGRDPLPWCDETTRDEAPCLGKFSVPTGAVAASLPSALLPGNHGDEPGESEVVLLLYGTAIAMQAEEQDIEARGKASSFLSVSTDGLHFSLLRKAPFSRDKFIIAGMVLLPEEVLRRTCRDDSESPLCHSDLGLVGDAVLMLGAGQPFRRSPLHLAVMRLSDLQTFYYAVDEETGFESWSRQEADATPVIDSSFGEVGLTLVTQEMCPVSGRHRCEDTLLLLANQHRGVTLRHALLSRPGAKSRGRAGEPSWSQPLKTSAAGYGPFAVEDFTRVIEDKHGNLSLELYHVVSSWDGKKISQPSRNPYGVFTRPLRLIDESTCQPASDGSGIPVCQDFRPSWPL